MHCRRRLCAQTCSVGLSLLELLVALAMIAMLIGVGQPWLADLVARAQVHAAALQLEAALQLARSEALARGRMVVVCPRLDDTHCDSGNGWANGWRVAVLDGTGVENAVLRIHPPLDAKVRLLGRNDGSPPAVALRYNRNGTLSAGGHYGLSATFNLCPATTLPDCRGGRTLVAGYGGQISITRRGS